MHNTKGEKRGQWKCDKALHTENWVVLTGLPDSGLFASFLLLWCFLIVIACNTVWKFVLGGGILYECYIIFGKIGDMFQIYFASKKNQKGWKKEQKNRDRWYQIMHYNFSGRKDFVVRLHLLFSFGNIFLGSVDKSETHS